jgi:tripartite-type tricarboxylate transporter receptor subunit TctC
MSKSKRQSINTLGSVMLLAGTSRSVFAQSSANYPSKPIRLVVPSAAGGSPDLICRLLATELATLLGQPVVVDNKPGAGGAIGMNDIFRATPDGYTLGYGNVVTLSINRSLYTKLSYDPDALTGIAQLGTVQNALVVRNELPVRNVKELIAYAKSRPGKLTMGSAGNGTTGHLGGEMFKSLTGTFITHVPYRGSAQAIQDLIGGQIDLMFDNLSSISSHIKGGRVRALAVSGAKRSALFPQLPTVQEEGVRGYETTAWGGIVGPKGLPADIVTRLNAEINKAIASPTLKEKYAQLAFESNTSTPTKILEMATLEAPRWADVIKRSGAKVD